MKILQDEGFVGACKAYATPTEAALVALTIWTAVGMVWQLFSAVLNAKNRIQEDKFASELRKGQASLAAFTRARRLAEEQDLEMVEVDAARGAADGADGEAAA
jgi:hypothetical protein